MEESYWIPENRDGIIDPIIPDSEGRFKLLYLIKPSIHSLVLAIDVDELAEEVFVNFPVVRIRVKGISIFNQVRDFVKADVSQTDGGDKGRAPAVGLQGILHLTNRAVQDIGKYLAPQV